MNLIARSSKCFRSGHIFNKASPIAVHFLMVAGVTIYTIFGAMIMQKLETHTITRNTQMSNDLKRPHTQIRHWRQNLAKANETSMKTSQSLNMDFEESRPQIRKCVLTVLRKFTKIKLSKRVMRSDVIYEIDHCYYARSNPTFYSTSDIVRSSEEHIQSWSFANSVLFCFTIITTIGYGNVAPKSFEGQMFCIVYGLVGVPFALLVIADLGKFLSEIIDGWERARHKFYKQIQKRWAYYNRTSKCLKIPSDLRSLDTNVYEHRKLIRYKSGIDKRLDLSLSKYADPTNSSAMLDEISYADKSSVSNGISDNEDNKKEDDSEKSTPNNNQTVPLLVLFLVYMLIGSLLLPSYEPDMTFFKAFYFNFVSLTSIGLGDVVPQSETYLVFTLIYIAVGLALTTIAIEIAADTLKKLHYFGRKIENVGNVVIWFGGKKLTMKSLVKNLGDQFNLPTTSIKDLDLDVFVDNAIKVEEGELETLRPPPIEPIDLDLMDYLVDYADEEEWIREETPTLPPDPPTPCTARDQSSPAFSARESTPDPETAHCLTPDLQQARWPTPPQMTARNLSPLTSPITAHNPTPELELSHCQTPTPTTAKELTPLSPPEEEWKKRGAYSEEAYRRYLEYKKQWRRYRHTSKGDVSVVDSATDPNLSLTSHIRRFSSFQIPEKKSQKTKQKKKENTEKPKKKK